jgi:hypothetical protein
MRRILKFRGQRTQVFGLWIFAIIVLWGMGPALACSPIALTDHQIRVKEVFDIWDRMLNNGNGFTKFNNINGRLSNEEPSVLNAYIRMYEATKDLKYLRKAVVHGDRILSHRDDIAGYTNYRGLSAPVWSNANPKYVRQGKAYPFVLDSGQLSKPLAYFAYLVRKEECLHSIKVPDGRSFSAIASFYISKVKETIRYHHKNWRIDSVDGRPVAFYILPGDADFIVGIEPTKPVPTNFQTAMGSTLLSVYMATNQPSYKKRSDRLGYFLREEMKYGSSNSCVFNYWPLMKYYPTGYVVGPIKAEDIGHAGLSMEFVRLYYENSLGIFYQGDIQRLSNTYLSKLDKGEGVFAHRLDGSGVATRSGWHQVGQYAFLSDQNPDVFESVENTLLFSLDLLNNRPASSRGYLSLANYLFQSVKRFPAGTSRCPWAKACRSDDDCLSSDPTKFSHHAADLADSRCYAYTSTGTETNSICTADRPTKSALGDYWMYDPGAAATPGMACEAARVSSVHTGTTTHRKRRNCVRKYKCR